ncbi:MAG: PAS domain S-box protein [Dehalococcoidia bacterium]|nr:PAS domain S-box protein [Dehalococcoidia bacterium]
MKAKADKKLTQGIPVTTEEMFRGVIENSGIGIYIVQDGKFQYVNPLFEEMSGYTDEELRGENPLNFVYPDDKQMVREKAVSSLKSGTSSPYEYRLVGKGGELVWVLERVASIQYEGKRASVASSIDITERKKAEERLQEAHQELEQSEQKYRSLVDNINDGWLVVQNQQVVFANQRVSEMVGYTFEEGIGRAIQEFLSSEVVDGVVERYERRLRGETIIPQQYETVLLRKDGSRFPVEISVASMLYDGSDAVSVLVRDITERKKNEKQMLYRNRELSITNRITTAVNRSLDIDKIIEDALDEIYETGEVDACWLQLADYESDKLLLKSHRGYTPEMVEEVTEMDIGESMAGEVVRTGKPMLLNKQSIDVEITVQSTLAAGIHSLAECPLKIADKVVGVLGVAHKEVGHFTPDDMELFTNVANVIGVAMKNAELYRERGKAEEEVERKVEELQIANQQLKELGQMKDNFLSTVSHELRTPLTSIKSFTEILLSYDEDRETQKEFLTIINEESDRLARLINDLLDLSKIESGRMQWNSAEVAIPEVIKKAVNTTQTLAAQAKLIVDVGLDSDLPPVWSDKDRMVQVITNLLSNAIKFTSEGGEIQVKARLLKGSESDGNPDMVVVSISDSGIGIAPEDQDAIFEKFRQVGNTLTEKPQGTGLGLPICREIVKHYDGRIWVESELGKGSTFSFALPVAEKAEAKVS